MSILQRGFVSAIALIICSLLGGCGDPITKPAIQLDPGYQPQNVDIITLLPPVDARFDMKEKVNLYKNINIPAANALKQRGYKTKLIEPAEGQYQYTKQDIKSADPEWIKNLGPSDANWLMILELDDVITKLTFGSVGNAEVSGYLYDKQTGTLIWRSKGVGKVGQGGLAGMMMGGAMKSAAIEMAVGDMIMSVPFVPKKQK